MSEKIFTKGELATFNGKNGQPAYVAINGTVYDVSGKAAWQNGKHHGNVAGQDLTETLFNKSPHKDQVLKGLPVVGKLA
ncbi:cytochrome b5 domain-containing protein [uncultured Limosilactobacillus sp.]|uniref:cytochrome b5 domain-containing protein n=1 Tax=uncultured Limosilactobacillus sp. TaxID=2837629 RepID=UPI0025D94826|nr:cytochrome b5 domain-containing protein [uncultured Limosilactobacillus sp.]